MQSVKALVPFARDLVWAENSASMNQIQTKMRAKGVSLIPLLGSGQHKNLGVVRRKAIWRWNMDEQMPPEVKDVREPALPEVLIDERLDDALHKLDNASALLLRDDKGQYTKLISPRVVAEVMQSYAREFITLDELEVAVRTLLGEQLTPACIGETLAKDPCTAESLTFSEYHTLFSKRWEELRLEHLDRKATLKLLDQVRDYRNAVMHFRPSSDKSAGQKTAEELIRLLG